MLTLGIHEGHTATACILENGKVLACISEERLNRKKEWEGFPRLAIAKCLEISGKRAEDFDAIGFCSLMPQIGFQTYHQPLLTKRIFGYAARLLPKRLLQRQSNIDLVQKIGWWASKSRREWLVQEVRSLGFTCPYDFYEHHHLHASTAFSRMHAVAVWPS